MRALPIQPLWPPPSCGPRWSLLTLAPTWGPGLLEMLEAPPHYPAVFLRTFPLGQREQPWPILQIRRGILLGTVSKPENKSEQGLALG